MCQTIANIPAHYSDECAEGGNGIGCDGGCACMRGCDCPCHSLHAQLFKDNDEVAAWHAPVEIPEPKQYRILDPSDTSDWTVDDHIDWIRTHAAQARMMNEIALNTQLTTWAHYAGIKVTHSLDLAETMNKYRKMGAIK